MTSLELLRDPFGIRDTREEGDTLTKQPVAAQAWGDGGLGLSCDVGAERVGQLSTLRSWGKYTGFGNQAQ